MTWCDTHSDREGEWSWNEVRGWSSDEWERQIAPSLGEIAKLDWKIILNDLKAHAKGNKEVQLHHHQEVSTLVNEAQERWRILNLEEYDTAFRFRFGGTTRAWGVRLKTHFYLIWWERHHKIYPV